MREKKKTGSLRIWWWEAVGISNRVVLAEEDGSATDSPSNSVGSLEPSGSRPAWVTQWDPCFKKKRKEKVKHSIPWLLKLNRERKSERAI